MRPLRCLCRAGQCCQDFRQGFVNRVSSIFVNADLCARRIDDRRCQACPVSRCNGQRTLMRIAGYATVMVPPPVQGSESNVPDTPATIFAGFTLSARHRCWSEASIRPVAFISTGMPVTRLEPPLT